MKQEEIILAIRQLFNKDKGNTLNKFLKQNKQIDDYLQKKLDEYPWFQNKRKCFSCIARGIYKPIICSCGKVVPLKKAIYGGTHCNSICASNDKQVIDKRKNTYLQKYGCQNIFYNEQIINKIKKMNMQKYGCENPFSNEQIKQKIKQTFLRKYGVVSPIQNEKIKQKIINTNLQRYGCKNVRSSSYVEQKIKKTCLQKYGCQYGFQSPVIRQKIKKTCLQKYGCENSGSSQQIIQKKKKTCLQRYGCENSSQSVIIKQKIKKTNLQKYGAEYAFLIPQIKEKTLRQLYDEKYKKYVEQFKDYVIPMFNAEQYQGHKKIYRWKCVKCGEQFQQQIYITGLGDGRIIPRCLKCFPSHASSIEQKHLLSFIKEIYDGKIITNYHNLISPYELDIVIPEQKLAIQFNGSYWHSIEYKCPKNYHLDKTEACQRIGYRLIHIWQDEWRDDQIIIKQKLKDVFNHDEKIEGEILDRSWYSVLQFNDYEILPPELILRNNVFVENCGYIKIVL